MNKPPRWTKARLDEIAEVRLGRQRSPDKAYGDNLVPYLRAANVRWAGLDLSDVKSMQFSPAEVETFRLRRDDILVVEASGSRDEVGKSALWREELPLVCLQNTLIRVRPRDGIDPEFLRWHLHFDASTGDLGGASKGIGIHHIGAARLASWMVNVPPRNEQRRIVAKLDTIFEQTRAAKAHLERLSTLLDKLKRSILAAAFRGDLTADWRHAHPNFEPASVLLDRIHAERRARWETALRTKGKDPSKAKYNDASSIAVEGGPLPRGWEWATIGGLCEVGTGATPKRGEPRFWENGRLPWVTSGATNSEYIEKASEFVTDRALAETNLTLFPAGTLLVAMYGEGQTRGRCAELRFAATTNQAVAGLVTTELPESLKESSSSSCGIDTRRCEWRHPAEFNRTSTSALCETSRFPCHQLPNRSNLSIAYGTRSP